MSEVVFAGHVVGNRQRKPKPEFVAGNEHWEKLKMVSELRAYLGSPQQPRDWRYALSKKAYLGFCNYYSGYIKMYAEYAAPMTAMLQGN